MILSCLLSIDTISGFVPGIDEQQTRIYGLKIRRPLRSKVNCSSKASATKCKGLRTSISFVS